MPQVDEPDFIPPMTPEERLVSAEGVVNRNVLWGIGAGVLPLPLIDVVAAAIVQIKMIKELSGLYGVPFREDLAKKLVASLVASVLGVGLGAGVAMSLGKFVPFLGTALGVVALPVVNGALTYATGRVFILHFESGGTLLDFDVAAMRAYFKAEFEAGKKVAARMYEDGKSKAPPV